ncbi:S8 family serine peptidase [Solwaraspora sp. WMMD1047]|uniref:S8 family serine peptidase n=1 Tax=Solwaraspora sp. WMMD1047 TaxID=3016102 RepID=UPI002415D4FA|nr:S8 family serine peptidase [Solwaraspora sp. WMMD1047]MDG4829499.1 S8 family serine peptidase [Solwaraspora sp. WMMD1047]
MTRTGPRPPAPAHRLPSAGATWCQPATGPVWRALAAGAFAVAAVVAVGPAPAASALPRVVPAVAALPGQGGSTGCAAGVRGYDEQPPWPQRLLAPDQVWPLTTGNGVRVAVVGTGVDARHPQFGADQVSAGVDVLSSAQSPRRDCDGRGTFAAGVIAARPAADTTFAGIAPGARIVPVRVTGAPEPAAEPGALADAIDAAVAADAEVICVVTPAAEGSAGLTAAIDRAVAADAVVVAPVAAPDPNRGPASFPAADERVLAVAAIDATGAPTTPEVDRVDVAAPGRALVGPAPGPAGRAGHLWPVDDDAMAAAYAAGVVALVRAYRPGLSARQVLDRVTRTADRAAGTQRDRRLGWGVVDLAAAVAAEGVDAAPATSAASPQAVRLATADDGAAGRGTALLAVAALTLAALVVIGTDVIRRGRARGWRGN